jgi:hypothetical protein
MIDQLSKVYQFDSISFPYRMKNKMSIQKNEEKA